MIHRLRITCSVLGTTAASCSAVTCRLDTDTFMTARACQHMASLRRSVTSVQNTCFVQTGVSNTPGIADTCRNVEIWGICRGP